MRTPVTTWRGLATTRMLAGRISRQRPTTPLGAFRGRSLTSRLKSAGTVRRAYEKACLHLDPPLKIVDVPHEGKTIRCHFRAPSDAGPDSPVAAVLIMCGADVFKEDRGWAGRACAGSRACVFGHGWSGDRGELVSLGAGVGYGLGGGDRLPDTTPPR